MTDGLPIFRDRERVLGGVDTVERVIVAMLLHVEVNPLPVYFWRLSPFHPIVSTDGELVVIEAICGTRYCDFPSVIQVQAEPRVVRYRLVVLDRDIDQIGAMPIQASRKSTAFDVAMSSRSGRTTGTAPNPDRFRPM